MKVLLCINSMGGGGAEKQIVYLIRDLVLKSVDTTIILLSKGHNYNLLKKTNCKIVLINNTNPLVILTKLLIYLIRNRPTLIYSWQRPFIYFCGFLSIILNIPIVHAERTNPSKIKKDIKFFLSNYFFMKSDGIICNSEVAKNYWIKKKYKKLINVIPNILPTDEMDKFINCKKLNNQIISVARLDKNKNIINLLRACKNLRDKINFKLKIYGEGELYNELDEYINNNNLNNNIILCGYNDNVWHEISKSKLFVAISFFEGESNSTLEAAYFNCNLILSKTTKSNIFIEDGVEYVNPNSINEIQSKILKLLKHNALKKNKFASNELKHRKSFYSANEHISFFKKIIKY